MQSFPLWTLLPASLRRIALQAKLPIQRTNLDRYLKGWFSPTSRGAGLVFVVFTFALAYLSAVLVYLIQWLLQRKP